MSNPTQDEIRAWLIEARQALHQLTMGQAVVSMSQGGRTLTFNQASRADLAAYVDQLAALLCPNARQPSRLFRMTQTGDGYSDG